jgi:hypothetical protein
MMRKSILVFLAFFFVLINCRAQQDNWQDDLIHKKYRNLYRQFSPEIKQSLTYKAFRSSLVQLSSAYGEPVSITVLNKEKGIYRVLTQHAALELLYTRMEKHITRFFIRPESYQQPEIARRLRLFRERQRIVLNDSQYLDGVLWLPDGVNQPPVVVMVHGSGPMDMDETVGPNKVFLDLAYALAEQGIASFRYEKRTKVYPSWMKNDSLGLKEETIDDAINALKMMRASSLIDSTSIWVLGHSLGGYALPEIMDGACFVAGGIILGGNSRPVHTLVQEQIEYLSKRDGKYSLAERRLNARMMKINRSIEAKKWRKLERQLTRVEEVIYWPVKFFRESESYDPVQVLKQSCSKATLILQGGRDYQVDTSNFHRWKLSGTSKVAYRLIPEVNHLFIRGVGVPGPSEYFIAGNVDERVSEYISEFIRNPRAFINNSQP